MNSLDAGLEWLSLTPLSPQIRGMSGCIRGVNSGIPKSLRLGRVNEFPRAGDLAVVRSLSDDGMYKFMEQPDETELPLRCGDMFIAVLANRYSGTSLSASVPTSRLSSGDQLRLIAAGGLVGIETESQIQPPRGMLTSVVGFPMSDEVPINTRDYPSLTTRSGAPNLFNKPIICVCGTSAEVGKTTTVCSLGRALRVVRPKSRLSAMKACGTGRMRDRRSYLSACYDVGIDFVDFGLPSTYGLGAHEIHDMLTKMLSYCFEHTDVCVVELGGDFLEAGAPEILAGLAGLGAKVILVVNDAMGAMEGMARLGTIGCNLWALGSYRQNLESLSQRLNFPPEKMFLPAVPASMESLVHELPETWTSKSS